MEKKKKLIPITNYKNYKTPLKEIENEQKIKISSDKKYYSQPGVDENSLKKKVFIKNPSGVSSLSLSSIKEKKDWKDKKENTIIIKNEKKEDFNEKDLLDIWNQYYILKKTKMQQNIASILKINNPKLKENYSIEFEVPSEINKVELEKELFEILDFLKYKLNNSMIKIKIIVNELEQKKSFIYSDEEKFKKFVETNSLIMKLKDEFGLEL